MSYKKVLIERIVSPDGKSIAEAHSIASVSGDSERKISQTVTVKISSGSSFSSSSTSSSSVSR